LRAAYFAAILGGVGDALDLLRRADSTAALPRLGGMARPEGVVIVSERFWAFAGQDGSLREGEMPKPPAVVQRLPLVRGLFRLGLSLAPLLRRTGVAGRKERPFLLDRSAHAVEALLADGSTAAQGRFHDSGWAEPGGS